MHQQRALEHAQHVRAQDRMYAWRLTRGSPNPSKGSHAFAVSSDKIPESKQQTSRSADVSVVELVERQFDGVHSDGLTSRRKPGRTKFGPEDDEQSLTRHVHLSEDDTGSDTHDYTTDTAGNAGT